MQPTAMTAAPKSAAVRASLSAFRRQHYAIDENNEDHVNAYLALRATNERCAGQQLATYISILKATVAVGEQNKATFWAVPRGNFPEGLPDAIKNALCPADVTRDCSFPASDYFFIDMMINRDQLGMGVATCSKVLNRTNEGRIDAAAGGDRATGGGSDIDGGGGTATSMLAIAANTAPSSGSAPSSGAATGVDLATSDAPATGVRTLKRKHSEATGEEPPSPESATVKKQRHIRQAFTTYRVGFDKAVKENRWTHQDGAMAPASAKSFVSKTTAGFESLLGDANGQEDKVAFVKKSAFKYTNHVLKPLLAGCPYPAICEFKGVLPRLLTLCGDQCDPSTRGEIALIELLAGITPDSTDSLNADAAACPFVFSSFSESQLYVSFLAYKAKQSLDAAFNAGTVDARMLLLEPMRSLQNIPPELSGSIQTAIMLTDPAVSEELKAAYLFQNKPLATDMAKHWFGAGVIGIIARLVEDQMPASFGDVAYDDFVKASCAVINAGLLEEDVCPLAKAAIIFSHEAKELAPPHLALCASAMRARIGTKDVEPTPTPAASKAEEGFDEVLYKKVNTFIPPGAKQPEWLVPWRLALDVKKAEDDAAKAEEAAKKEEQDKKDADAHARFLGSGGDTGVAGAATGVVAVATGVGEPGVAGAATGGGAGSSKDFILGQIVVFKGAKGKVIKASISMVQTRHCWVNILPDQGGESGLRKRILSKSLCANEEVAPPVATAESPPPPATSVESSGPPVTSVVSTEPPATSPPPQASTSTDVPAGLAEQERKAADELATERADWEGMFDMFGEGDPVLDESMADAD